MNIPKYSTRRLVSALIVIPVCGLFLYGFFIWLNAVPTAQNDFSAESARTLFQQQTGDASGSEISSRADSLQMLALNSDVEKFRTGAVNAPETKAVTELPEVAPGAMQDFLKGEISAKFPYIWSYVIAGSFIVMGNTLGDDPVVAFYNPYFDVAILTKWSFKKQAGTRTKPGFMLMQAVPVTGRAFIENRPSLSTDQPIWADSKALFEVRIVKAAQDFVAAFEKRYPPFGRDSAAFSADAGTITTVISVAENRVFYLLRWVIDAQDSAAPVNYAAGINKLREALSAPSPASLGLLLPKNNPQSAETFFRLPRRIRQGMKPYLVIDKNVIFLDPTNLPTGFISVYFTPDAKGYVPGLMAMFNLEASYPDH